MEIEEFEAYKLASAQVIELEKASGERRWYLERLNEIREAHGRPLLTVPPHWETAAPDEIVALEIKHREALDAYRRLLGRNHR